MSSPAGKGSISVLSFMSLSSNDMPVAVAESGWRTRRAYSNERHSHIHRGKERDRETDRKERRTNRSTDIPLTSLWPEDEIDGDGIIMMIAMLAMIS